MSKYKVGEVIKYINTDDDGYTIDIIGIEKQEYIVNINVDGVIEDNPRRYTIDLIDRKFRHLTPLEKLL